MLAIGGEGEVIEWAVEMLRFDEDRTLDRIAETRGIDDDLAARLAGMVLAMHRAAPIADAAAWIAALAEFLNQNAAAFREEPALFNAERSATLDRSARVELDRRRGVLLGRGARGLIRQGHGDLHLGNLFGRQHRNLGIVCASAASLATEIKLKRNCLIEAHFAQSGIQVRKTADLRAFDEFLIDFPLVGALVAGHQEHPILRLQFLQALAYGIALLQHVAVIHEEKHTDNIHAMTVFLHLGNDHGIQYTMSQMRRKNISYFHDTSPFELFCC